MRSRLLTSNAPLPAILALRYLWSTRRRASTTFLSVVAVGAIGLGVFALIVSLAALSGFQQVLRTEVLARTPDIEVELSPETADEDVARAAAAVRALPGVREVQQVVRGRGWLLGGGRVAAAELVGFDGPLPPAFPGASAQSAQSAPSARSAPSAPSAHAPGGVAAGEERPGLWISRRLASAWFLEVGDPVDVVSPRPTLTPLGPRPRVRTLPVAGVYDAGKVAEQERSALPLDVAESLFGPGRRRLLIDAGGSRGALAVAATLGPVLPEGARIETWQDLNRPLFFALRLERIFLFLGVSLIMLVAALALLADLMLIVANKREDVGMLLTLGATPARLRRAFVLLGGLLALAGTTVGGATGVVTALVADRLRLLKLPGDVFFVEHVPFVVHSRDLALILGVTLTLALAASFYGAHRAAALDPVEALRR